MKFQIISICKLTACFMVSICLTLEKTYCRSLVAHLNKNVSNENNMPLLNISLNLNENA